MKYPPFIDVFALEASFVGLTRINQLISWCKPPIVGGFFSQKPLYFSMVTSPPPASSLSTSPREDPCEGAGGGTHRCLMGRSLAAAEGREGSGDEDDREGLKEQGMGPGEKCLEI